MRPFSHCKLITAFVFNKDSFSQELSHLFRFTPFLSFVFFYQEEFKGKRQCSRAQSATVLTVQIAPAHKTFFFSAQLLFSLWNFSNFAEAG